MTDNIRKLWVSGLFVLGIVFAIQAYREHKPFSVAKVKHKAVIDAVVTEPDGENSRSVLDRKIDFLALQKINPDIIGWLYAPQIGVDNPILQGSNDTEYLNKDFEGKYSPLGAIFTWADADEKLTDQQICLFGHNMMSGQMFGQLDAFEDVDFRKENSKLYLYTPESSKELEVVSVFICDNKDEVFQNKQKEKSDQQTVILVTCTGYGRTPYRLVVKCKVV